MSADAVEGSPTGAFGSAFKGKRIFITGHTGFKGAWLTAWLLQMGADVCGYSIDIPTNPSLFETTGLKARIRHIVGDIRNTKLLRVELALFEPDFFFHMAAQPIVSVSYRDPVDTVSVNVLGTACVLEALRSLTRPCVAIIVASDKCYENVEQPWGYREIDPLGGKDVYSGSKGAAEIIFNSFHASFFSSEGHPIRLASVRAGNVIGGGDWALDRIIVDCVKAWNENRSVELRRPSSTRPWQHVLEPLGGYLALAAALAVRPELSGENFNFGPRAEQNHSVLDLIRDLAGIWGGGEWSAAAGPTFHEAGLLKLNCDKALVELGWQATLSYDECVRFTGDWYRNVVKEHASAAAETDRQIANYQTLAAARGSPWMASAAA